MKEHITSKLYELVTEKLAYSELKRKVHSLIDSDKKLVEFSIFVDAGNVDDEWQVRAPDIESTDTIIEGEVIFYSDYWRLTDYNNGVPCQCEAVTNPTWKDIINAANKLLEETNKYQLFLEGLTHVKNVGEYKMVRVDFGS